MKTRQLNQSILVTSFLIVLLVVGILHLIVPEQDLSQDEARTLAHFPKLSYADARSGMSAVKIEKWYNDQFPFRESFIRAGQSWRDLAYPNLNRDGMAIYLMPDEDNKPATPETLPVETSSPATRPVESGPEMTEPPPSLPLEPPALEPAEEIVSLKSLVIVNQRAMERYYGNEERLKAYGERLNRLQELLGGKSQLYSMIVPTAIELYAPDEYHYGYSSQKDCIGMVNEVLDPSIRTVNAYDQLLYHRDQYIYYRTDHHWTGLGAYYAYVAFCESAGLEAVKLEEMEHYQIEGDYLGSLYRISKSAILENNPDMTEGWKPKAEYTATAWDDSQMTVTYQTRLNNEAIKGSNSYLNFSGGDRALLKIETTHGSGRKILVVKDSFGNAFVPYLANNFDEILVIDPRYYVRDMSTLVEDSGVTDILIMNYMFGTSNQTWLAGFDLIAK